jgi:hypothetical protein
MEGNLKGSSKPGRERGSEHGLMEANMMDIGGMEKKVNEVWRRFLMEESLKEKEFERV